MRRHAVRRPRHVLDRHDHLEVELAYRTGIDDPDWTVAPQVPADLLERALRGTQADALEWPPGERFEALQRQGEVRPPLRARHRVDLVDNHRFDRPQRF